MPSGSAGPRVKGGAIRDLLLYYEDRFGREYASAAAHALEGESALLVWPDRVALGLLPNLWYPSEVIVAILDAIAMRHDEETLEELMVSGSDLVVRRLSEGAYQVLFRLVASPELYAKHIQRAWDQLHTTGKRKVEIVDKGVAESSIFDWAGHHRLLCRTVNHTTRALFGAMGYRHVELISERCVSRGDHFCKNRIHYRID